MPTLQRSQEQTTNNQQHIYSIDIVLLQLFPPLSDLDYQLKWLYICWSLAILLNCLAHG